MLTDSCNRSALDLQVNSPPAHLHSVAEAVCSQAGVYYGKSVFQSPIEEMAIGKSKLHT